MKKNKKLINSIVIIAVLIIPFMYSFFYLKAYWNPYGEGNIDNLPVVIVNNDEGEKGKKVIDSIVNSGKLKISVLSEGEATSGLSNGDYYALINIPTDFTKSLESASEKDKKHATITYSANQKSNYLASQIINSVVNAVEKSLDNEVNSAIVESLSDNLNSVPSSLEEISDGFKELNNGTQKLENGAKEVHSGASSLNQGMKTLQTIISTIYNGSKDITEALDSSISSMSSTSAIDASTLEQIKKQAISGATSEVKKTFTDEYKNAIGTEAAKKAAASVESEAVKSALAGLYTNETYKNAKNGMKQIENGLSELINGYNANFATNLSTYSFCKQYVSQSPVTAFVQTINQTEAVSNYCPTYITAYEQTSLIESVAKQIASSVSTTVAKEVAYQVAIESSMQASLKTAESVAGSISTTVATSVAESASKKTLTSLSTLSTNLNTLTNGLSTLNSGSSINKLYTGMEQLVSGTNTLYKGTTTLNSSVSSAKKELDSNIKTTKKDLETLDGLKNYSSSPVNIETKPTNEITSYGTAFAPLFISIGLWVGCLMMFVVFYYDKENRFKVLGKDSKEYIKRSVYYHGLATISGIILGFLLNAFLDFNITSITLYYVSIILIANLFMAIMETLIVNFDDVGKFLALIILVLQLAASGGTFPIQTVTKGFRFLNNYLPMTYTINLLKESLVKIESSLLIKNITIVIVILIVLVVINLINDIIKQHKNN